MALPPARAVRRSISSATPQPTIRKRRLSARRRKHDDTVLVAVTPFGQAREALPCARPAAYIRRMVAPYTHIEVRPMAGALGADVQGVDLAQALDDATFAEIERAFHDHLVLFFHDQRLTPEQHLAFSR